MAVRPEGDPAAMEAAARAILEIAGRLDGVDGLIVHALPAHAFEARGRTALNGTLRTAAQSVDHTAASLQRLAGQLGRGAGELRRAQHRWDADERDRREREAEAARRTAASRAR